MTVANNDYFTDWVQANGANKNFSYDFTVFTDSSLTVEVRAGLDGAITQYTDNFNMYPAADFGSGYVQYPVTGAAISAGNWVRIVRQVTYTQLTEIGREGAFHPDIHERAFDNLTLQTQQLAGLLDRAVLVPVGQQGPTVDDITAAEGYAEEAKDARDEAQDIADSIITTINPYLATKLQTLAVDGQLEYDLLSPVPAVDGHLHLNVYIGGRIQPKDGEAYTITAGGTKILFSEEIEPTVDLYADGALIYGVGASVTDKTVFNSVAEFINAVIPATISTVRIAGWFGPGDMGEHDVTRIDTPNPVMSYHKQSSGGDWWEPINNRPMRAEIFGGFPHIVGDEDTLAWYDAIDGDIRFPHFQLNDMLIRLLKARGLWDKASFILNTGQHTQQAGLLDMKNPTRSATVVGTVTHSAGEGISGDGVTGYLVLPPMNELFTRDSAALFLASNPGTTSGTLVSSEGGVAAGISINPSSGTSVIQRFCSGTATSPAKAFRRAFLTLNRLDATGHYYYEEGYQQGGQQAAPSTALTADPIWIFRSSTAYQNDLVRMFISFNEALTEQEVDDLDAILDWYLTLLPSSLDKGPLCEEIGFTPRCTDAERTAAMYTAYEFAKRKGDKVRLHYGTYLMDNIFPGFTSSVETEGIDRYNSIIRHANSVNKEIPLCAPTHYKGGECLFFIHKVMLDGAAAARGITDAGIQRPGGSAISTNGSQQGAIADFCVFDPVLHSLDYSNTGEVVAGRRYYAYNASKERRVVGIPSENISIRDGIMFNCSDDHGTSHYSRGGPLGIISNIKAFFTSGRHSTPRVSCGWEADDGSENFRIFGLYARGLSTAAGAKNHTGNPGPRDITFTDVESRMCGRTIWFQDGNEEGVGNLHATRFKTRKPFAISDDIVEISGAFVRGVSHFSLTNFDIEAQGGETFLRPAIEVQNNAKHGLIQGGVINNWKGMNDIGVGGIHSGETVRLTSSTAYINCRDFSILGAGERGFFDSGSAFSDASGITISGLGVSGSIGFQQSGATNASRRGIHIIDDYSAGVSGFETPIGAPSAITYTIAGGVLTILDQLPQQQLVLVAGEGGLADSLTTINGLTPGDTIIIRPADTTTDITVKHGTGNLFLTGLADIVLTNRNDAIHFVCESNNTLSMIGGGNNQA